MNYEEKSDFEINCMVAVAVEPTLNHGFSYEKENGAANFRLCDPIGDDHDAGTYNFCEDWSAAGPIIVENCISILAPENGILEWDAIHHEHSVTNPDNPLRAAMIVFLKMKEQK